MGVMSLDEPIFDNGQGILVTTSLLRVGDDAYPIGSIKSVQVSRVRPCAGMVAMAATVTLLGLALTAFGLVVGPTGIAVFGAILLLAAYHVTRGLFMYGWQLRLIGLTGITEVTTSPEQKDLQEIKIEIETALAMRHMAKLPTAASPRLDLMSVARPDTAALGGAF